MPRLFSRLRKRVGASPGTVEFIGPPKIERVRMRVIDYSPDHFEEKELAAVADCFPYRDPPRVSWLNIDGLHDTQLLTTLAEHFGIHPLVLEDIVHTQQRPKMEDHQDHLYIVIKMLYYDEEQREVSAEQVSLILGPSYVLSFQERVGDIFESVRERLRKGKGRARGKGSDYLAYMLLDAIVDHYFIILEKIGEEIERLEDDLVAQPTAEMLQTIHELKREMIILRRSVWPLREVVSGLERTETELVEEGTGIFLRDLYDHTIQVVDGVESFRDMLAGLQDLYLSSISNKMNEVMKVLTIMATVFIPLSFIAGVFGMNFDHMPELHWKWSYGVFWILILSIAGGMLAYFRKRGWM